MKSRSGAKQDHRETSVGALSFEFSSNVSEGIPVINQTINPLVFLYSAPPCPPGSRMRVQFQTAGGRPQSTPYKACQENLSMNFYLGGLRTGAEYSVRHAVNTGSELINGPVLTLTTPVPTLSLAGYNVLQPHPIPATDEVLLQSTPFQFPVATDLNGNVLHYPVPIRQTGGGGRLFRAAGDGVLDLAPGSPAIRPDRRHGFETMRLVSTNSSLP